MKLLSTLLWCAMLIALPCQAAPVSVVRYEGTLTLAGDGSPVTALRTMRFRLYDDELAGGVVWDELQDVGVQDGRFTVDLGRDTALSPSVFEGGPRYLAVSVLEDGIAEELSPRRKRPADHTVH